MTTKLWSERKLRRITLLVRLHKKGSREVLSELRWFQRDKRYEFGWVRHCYHEIFGDWLSWHGAPDPICPSDGTVEEWLVLGKRISKPKLPF